MAGADRCPDESAPGSPPGIMDPGRAILGPKRRRSRLLRRECTTAHHHLGMVRAVRLCLTYLVWAHSRLLCAALVSVLRRALFRYSLLGLSVAANLALLALS